MTPVVASVLLNHAVNSAPICCHPLTNITENESVPFLPWSLRSSVHSPPGQAAETESHRVTAAIGSGIISYITQCPALCWVTGRYPGGWNIQGRPTGCPCVGCVSSNSRGGAGGRGGLRRVHLTQDTTSGLCAPARQGQAWADDPGAAGSRSRSRGTGAGSPLCDLEELTPPCHLRVPHLHLGPRCIYMFMSCASISWRLSCGCFWSGTEL